MFNYFVCLPEGMCIYTNIYIVIVCEAFGIISCEYHVCEWRSDDQTVVALPFFFMCAMFKTSVLPWKIGWWIGIPLSDYYNLNKLGSINPLT